MKILVGTKQTQGTRRTDFSYVDEGDLVLAGVLVECDRENVDGVCGCRRSFDGLRNMKATTTARIVEAEIDGAYLAQAVTEALTSWLELVETNEERTKLIEGEVEGIHLIASKFAVGSVIEKRGSNFQLRKGGYLG